MQVVNVPLTNTSILHPLAKDYLLNEPGLNAFYSFRPDLDGAARAVEARQGIPVSRKLLADRLELQYQGLDKGEKVAENIRLLRMDTTFTITTGHQLNIFTGPLYFIYKIFSAISYAEYLKKEFPDRNFVPVYWMASEDHDFDEINHVHLWNKTFYWEKRVDGPVGRMSAKGLEKILNELKGSVRETEESKKLFAFFEAAYINEGTLAAATRRLVHELFKAYGLLIIDADDKELKKALIPVILEDIFQNSFSEEVTLASSQLQRYKLPVNPREINVFYLDKNSRSRIVMENGSYTVLDSDKAWTAEELEAEINSNPENFSPNVILRPLYQEIILPNIAYIGGNNEIAYWLQLRLAFEKAGVFYPQLLVRDSAVILGKRGAKDLLNFGLSPVDLLNDIDALQGLYYRIHSLEHKGEGTTEEVIELYNRLRDEIQDLPKDLISYVIRQLNQHQKEVKKWQNDIHNRQLEQQEKNLEKLQKLHAMVFPSGILQERYDNLIPYFLQYGEDIFRLLQENFNPLSAQLHIFIEEV